MKKEKMRSEYIPTEEGSRVYESLLKNDPGKEESGLSGAPWSLDESLKSKCDEVGVNADDLISGIGKGRADEELAEEMNVPVQTIEGLKKSFLEKGLDSIQGQD